MSLKRIVLAPNEARVARLGRYFQPDQPQHVIQHGNNRQAIFFCEDDHRRLHAWLAEAAATHRCAPLCGREPNRAGDCQRQPGAGRPPLLFELRCCATAELAAAVRGILCQCQYLQWATGAATSRRRLSAKYTFATKMGSFSFSNYDGQSFMVSGKATTAAGGTQYSVPIAGGINGSFYGPLAAARPT